MNINPELDMCLIILKLFEFGIVAVAFIAICLM